MTLPVVSRVLTLVGAVISDWVLVDHQAGGVEAFNFEYSSEVAKALFNAFTRWDSVHMLKIAAEGYHHEHQLVFFPLFPALLRVIAGHLPALRMTEHEQLLVAALVLNIVAFSSASYASKRLLQAVFPAMQSSTLNLAMWMFYFNPAGVFFSMPYTEALFAALSWTGFLLFAQGNDGLSIIPLCLASFLRSNGSLNIIVVGSMWLGRPASKANVSVWSDVMALLVASAIVMPAVLLNHIHLHILCAESLVCATCLCPVDVSNLLPTLSSWFLHSSGTTTTPLLRISTDAQTMQLCQQHGTSFLPPVVYSYLQGKYWNVGFMRQYHWRQIPNFALAVPIWCIVVYTVYYARSIFAGGSAGSMRIDPSPSTSKIECSDSSDTDNTAKVSEGARRQRKKGRKTKQKHNISTTRLLDQRTNHQTSMFANISGGYAQLIVRPETPFVAHLLVLLVISVFFAHVQMSTRLFCAASPVVYVGMAHIVERRDWTCSINLFGRKCTVSWVYVYIVVYNVLGLLLHCNYHPWT